jgi:hypothetical protein
MIEVRTCKAVGLTASFGKGCISDAISPAEALLQIGEKKAIMLCDGNL